MIKNFLHLNGVTYELASPVPSTTDERWATLQTVVEELVGGGHADPVPFTVILEGTAVDLRVQPGNVFSAGLFLKEETVAWDPFKR